MLSYSDLTRSRGVGKNMRYSMYWSLEKEILLIKYFEQHRYLWDTEHVLFHKREPRMKSFAELVEILEIDEGTIRQRWSSMRSQFCREERKVSMTPNYVPTWDHYNALLFLRKPNQGLRYVNMYTGNRLSPPIKDEYSDIIEQNQPVSEEDDEGTSNGYSFPQQQMESIVQRLHQEQQKNVQQQDDEQNNDAVANSPSPQNRQDPSITEAGEPVNEFRPETPTQLIRKYKGIAQRTGRRWNPGYSRKCREIAANVMTTGNTPIIEANRQPSENESFTQYIASVLERFSSEQQRRCRNELLRVILKYDVSEDDVSSPARSDNITH